MIFGIGTDIVSIKRMQDNVEKHGTKFAERILSNEELEEYHRYNEPARLLAKRFAVKEAASKAMGTGFRDGISLKHIFVTHNDLGKPILNFIDVAKDFLLTNNINQSHVSISDEQDYAVAYVMLEK